MNLHELLVGLQKFEGPGGPFFRNLQLHKDCLFAAFALFVPLCSSKQGLLPGNRLPKHVIDVSAPAKIKWLCSPMAGSKVFLRGVDKRAQQQKQAAQRLEEAEKAAEKAACQDKEGEADASEGELGAKRRKGKAGIAKAKAATQVKRVLKAIAIALRFMF